MKRGAFKFYGGLNRTSSRKHRTMKRLQNYQIWLHHQKLVGKLPDKTNELIMSTPEGVGYGLGFARAIFSLHVKLNSTLCSPCSFNKLVGVCMSSGTHERRLPIVPSCAYFHRQIDSGAAHAAVVIAAPPPLPPPPRGAATANGSWRPTIIMTIDQQHGRRVCVCVCRDARYAIRMCTGGGGD